MKFKKSLIISGIFHILLLVLVPGFKFKAERTDWIEVSVVIFPDIRERKPDWMAGRRALPEPSLRVPEVGKIKSPIPVDKAVHGVAVEPLDPKLPDFVEIKYDVPLDHHIEKSIPGREERKGILDEEGFEDELVISGPVSRRNLLRKIIPEYPQWAEDKGVEGEVRLKFWVSPDGTVASVEMETTSGYPDLDSRAMRAVRKYLFSPLGKDEEQEMQWGTITIRYTLR